MTTPSQPPHTHDQLRRVVTALLHGTGLHVEQRRLELVITNPADPEKGQVCISLDDGYVTWERTVTDYWGRLDGIPTPTPTPDQDTRTIPITKIIEALTSRM
jgi:hypothetical protein